MVTRRELFRCAPNDTLLRSTKSCNVLLRADGSTPGGIEWRGLKGMVLCGE